MHEYKRVGRSLDKGRLQARCAELPLADSNVAEVSGQPQLHCNDVGVCMP